MSATRALCEEIENSVPQACKWKRPGVAAAQTKGRCEEGNGGERSGVRFAADHSSELHAEPSGRGDAVARKACREIHLVDFSSMRHDVESEVERAAPNVFHFGVAELRVDVNHAPPKNFCALANRVFGFGEKGSATAEQHAIVRGQAIVVEEVLGVVDHAVARADFEGKVGWQNLGSDDVGS